MLQGERRICEGTINSILLYDIEQVDMVMYFFI